MPEKMKLKTGQMDFDCFSIFSQNQLNPRIIAAITNPKGERNDKMSPFKKRLIMFVKCVLPVVRRMAVTVKHNPNGKWGFARPERNGNASATQKSAPKLPVGSSNQPNPPPAANTNVLRVFNPLSDGNTRSTSFASKKMSKV